jgi:hypothetical protein
MFTPSNTAENLECQGFRFWQIETKLIIIAIFGFIITMGCVITLIMNKGQNCALNNGIFTILGSIIGLCTGLFNSNRCRKNSLT